MTSADGILAVMASNWTVANAVCPSLAIISGDTEVTEGSGRIPAERLVDSGDHIGSIDRRRGVEDDLGVVAGLGREALGQDRLGLLGLADSAEVVLEAGADRGGNGDHHDDPDGPSQEDRSAVVVTPRPGPAEPVGAVLAGCCGPLRVCCGCKSHWPMRR